METLSEDLNAETKVGAEPNSTPETDAERRAVDSFRALQAAELGFREGVEFGEAVIALRAEIKASGGRNWMDRLEQLGVTYEKARYWMAVAQGKSPRREAAKPQQEPVPDWQAALAKLRDAIDAICARRGEASKDQVALKYQAEKLAGVLGYGLVTKEEDNA